MTKAMFDFDANSIFVAEYDRGPPLFNLGNISSI